MVVIFFVSGILLGSVAAWFVANLLSKSKQDRAIAEIESQLKISQNNETHFNAQIGNQSQEIINLRTELENERLLRVTASTQLEDANKNLREQKALLEDAQTTLSATFKAISSDALKSNNTAFIELAQQTLEKYISEAKGDLTARQVAISTTVTPLTDALARYETSINDMERVRQEAYGGLAKHLENLAGVQEKLQVETKNLSNALRLPQVKGKWGQVTLRRVVEVAGMSSHCDFKEQVSLETEDGRLIPDLVVQLPSNRSVVVDAKVPLVAYNDAIEEQDEEAKKVLLEKHVLLVKDHVKKLSAKEYWAQFSSAPEFVVLFMPTESSFSAALEQDRTLIDQTIAKGIILATPTTLIALLKTVAYSWQEHQLTENSRKIADAGVELYNRIAKFADYFQNVGGIIEKLNHAYSEAVGSWDSRLVAGAKKLKELGAAPADKEFPEIKKIEAQPRQMKPILVEKED